MPVGLLEMCKWAVKKAFEIELASSPFSFCCKVFLMQMEIGGVQRI